MNRNSHCRCGGCSSYLAYPTGAAFVRCSQCGVINNLQRATVQIRCEQCITPLVCPSTAPLVQCPVCRHINSRQLQVQPQPQGSRGQMMQQQQQQQRRVPTEPVQIVVVQNPPTIDIDGSIVQNLSVAQPVKDVAV